MNDLNDFRESVRAWLEENAPDSLKGKKGEAYADFWGGKKTPPPYPDSKAWRFLYGQRNMAAEGSPKRKTRYY